MIPRSAWIAAAIAVAALAVVVVVVGSAWLEIGDNDISANGWAAMILGILLTVGLGVGLMALVFISARRGYDEPGRRR